MLVDGEHYPPVVRAALDAVRAEGRTIAGVALLGGTEKLARKGEFDVGTSDVVTASTPLEALRAAIERFTPDEIIDLSDPPIVDSRTRMLLAAHALARGCVYRGPGYAFDPPPRPRIATKPSIAVIGSGKRTGKTAIAAAIARALAAQGRPPVIVAMGRGGPELPEVIDPSRCDLSPRALLGLADSGRHAASDHLEDAVTTGLVTIGTRRCGGGLAGTAGPNTFRGGVELANQRPEPLMMLEGSGTALPPVDADVAVSVISAESDPELVSGYLGGFPLLLSDLVVVTLLDEPSFAEGTAGTPELPPASAPRAGELEQRIREIVPEVPVLSCVLRPWPLGLISERRVFFSSTAPEPVAARLAAHLETRHGAVVVGWSSHLANRARLVADLEQATGAELLVTELKAAAVDVAVRAALDRGMEVVFCDNRPATPDGDPDVELDEAARRLADLATERFV